MIDLFAPDDFEAFWAARPVRLDTIPMIPKLTTVESGQSGIEAFDLQLDWRDTET